MLKIISKAIIVLFMSFTLYACGGAKSELEDMGILFTQDEYFKKGVAKQNIPVIQLFLEAGMSVETEDSAGVTALSFAIDRENVLLIRMLVEEYEAVIDVDHMLKVALKRGNLEMIQLAVDEYGAEVEGKNYADYPVYNYPRKDEKIVPIATYLFSKGATFSNDDSNGRGGAGMWITTRVISDVKKIRFETALLYAQNGLNERSSTHMMEQIYSGFPKHIRSQYQNYDDVTDEKHEEKLSNLNLDLEIVKVLIDQLIQNGADLDTVVKRFAHDGEYYRGDWMITFIQPLLDNGWDINKPGISYTGDTLLSMTVDRLKTNRIDAARKTVIYLFENGADSRINQSEGMRRQLNALQLFCRFTSDGRDGEFPIICDNQDHEMFKLFFSNYEKYLTRKEGSAGLIMARQALKKKDYKAAYEAYLPYAGEGVFEAQENIAEFLYKGQGVEQDYTKSAFWLKKIIDQGAAGYWQYYRYATLFQLGLGGLDTDLKKAEELIRKSLKLATDWSKTAEKQAQKKLDGIIVAQKKQANAETNLKVKSGLNVDAPNTETQPPNPPKVSDTVNPSPAPSVASGANNSGENAITEPPSGKAAFTVESHSPKIMYLTSTGRIRQSPDVKSPQVATQQKGSPIIVVGKTDVLYKGAPWSHIQGDFGEGFVWSKLLSAQQPRAPVNIPSAKKEVANTNNPVASNSKTGAGEFVDNFKKDLGTVFEMFGN